MYKILEKPKITVDFKSHMIYTYIKILNIKNKGETEMIKNLNDLQGEIYEILSSRGWEGEKTDIAGLNQFIYKNNDLNKMSIEVVEVYRSNGSENNVSLSISVWRKENDNKSLLLVGNIEKINNKMGNKAIINRINKILNYI